MLDREVNNTIAMAWAPNTRATRNSQWKKIISFCSDNKLPAVPADPQTVARFLVYLARSVKYVTVNNYLSAIIRLHDYYNHATNFRNYFLIKLVLRGIKRQLGDTSNQKIPLTPRKLLSIHSHLDFSQPATAAC